MLRLYRYPIHPISRAHNCSAAKYHKRLYSSKACEPLRILFCGSDEFSIASLRALDRKRKEQPELIASIDVVCRPEKHVQRNLKQLREVPIAPIARDLDLPLHQIDTFTQWEPPVSARGPINIIIAVSFGLLVPSRILGRANYGGLNVHPSMLPEFRGPAPLHHTLLTGQETTGVTLQTLHPTRFDEGKIISQTPHPGIKHGAKTVDELRNVLAPIGAQMLVQAIEDRSFFPPVEYRELHKTVHGVPEYKYASKITPKDRHIDWATWTANDILNRQRIIGPLWNISEALIKNSSGESREAKRLIWDQGFRLLKDECHLFPAIGHPIIVGLHGSTQNLYVRTCDGQILVANEVKVEGQTTAEVVHAAKRTGLVPLPMKPEELRQFHHDFVAFHSQLR